MLVCDKCGGKILEGSQFCPQCGDPVTEADLPADSLAASTSAPQVEVSFGRSSSASYDQAVQISKNIPTYREEGEGKTLRHTVDLPISEIELLINLWELVGSWKTSRMLINGQPATKSALVYKGAGCYRNRQKAFNREQYCYGENQYEFNIWGCKRLNMPVSEWGGGWLDFGRIDQAGVWHFDKDRIRHELELGIHEHELCPVLNRQQVMDTLDRMPDRINPKSDPNWTYRTDYQDVRGDYKEVAVGIKPVLKRANQYVVGEFKPKWEVPESGSPAAERHVIHLQLDVPDTSRGGGQPTRTSKSGCLVFLIPVLALAGGALGLLIC